MNESSKFQFVPWKQGLSSKTYWKADHTDFHTQSMMTILPVATLRRLLEKYDE